MTPEQQRLRHRKRIFKAFGRCLITWRDNKAHLRLLDKELRYTDCVLYRKGCYWVLEVPELCFRGSDPILPNLVAQLKLANVLGG